MNNKFKDINDFYETSSTFNANVHFIAPNPVTSFNPESVHPKIHETAYVGPFSTIIGDVTIRKNVFIASNASIRADEGSPFYIGSNSNIQDGVVLHGLKNSYLEHDNIKYSIYIGKNVSCSHKCIIHGPCIVDDNTFIGFNSIVINAEIGASCYISFNALVTGGVTIKPDSFVPAGAIIDTQEKADSLGRVPKEQVEFAKSVLEVNKEFPNSYSLMFGDTKCSCGLTCSSDTLKNRFNNI